MKLSLNFVKDYIDLPENLTVEQIAEDMTLHSSEYDEAGKLVNATNLTIGEVVKCKDHPDSDHLHVCKVNIGKEVLDIVCGAPNVRKGLKVIVALPGAKLPGGEIKKGVIRGQESNGMLCSMLELGIENKYVDEMPASEVTYVRSFGTKNVQSWYVPFDYTITEEDANNFLFYKIHMIAASGKEQGGDVSDNTKVYIYIEPLAAGTLMKANRPYVIKAQNPVQNYNFIAKDIDKLYKPDDTSRLHNETTEFTYDFFGTYGLVYCDDALHWIAISGGLACPLKENTPVQQYRWYIKISPKSYQDDYAKLNFIFVEGDGETNGISAQTIDGEIEGIYTLGGMKVEHPVKGVNIIKYTDGRTKKINVK